MTVSMQVSKRIYTGNGITREWEVDFPLASAQDVRVYVTSPAGVETELTSDFELNPAGTILTYPTVGSGKPPLADGWSVTLVRQTPLTQEIDLLRQGELDAEVLESGYDKLTLMVQELDEKVSRSIKYPVSANVADQETDTFLRNILAIKQEALNASSSAVLSAQEAQSSAAAAQQTAQGALGAIAASQAAAQDEIAASGMKVEEALKTYVETAHSEAETCRYYAERTIGKTVGEVYYSQSSAEADNPGALPLFTGETIASADTLYPDFYAWVQKHSDLTCTSKEYEAALAEYGECAKYVAAEGSIRLPLLKNYVKMANAQEGITQAGAGLPNITGTIPSATEKPTGDYFGGAFANTGGNSNSAFAGGTNFFKKASFDASRSSAVYGGSETVTPAHTTLYPWVFAYNAAVPASTAQAGAFQQALSGKADSNLGNISPNIDYVVESYSDEAGNWYRKYKSGWLEQGGYAKGTVTFLKPYKAAPKVLVGGANTSGDGWPPRANMVSSTGFYLYGGNADSVAGYWHAEGQGE